MLYPSQRPDDILPQEEHSTCVFCGGEIYRPPCDFQWWHFKFCYDFVHIACSVGEWPFIEYALEDTQEG